MFQAINNSRVYESSLAINKEQYKLEKTTDEPIKILQLTDLQFASYFEAGLSLGIAKGVIAKTKPDLIVLTGDNITNNSDRKHAELLVRFFDSFRIPWALVLGKHDYCSKLSPVELSDIYESSEYCIYSRGNVDDSFGNYAYSIVHGDQIDFSLLFMDSGTDGFASKHVDWYENQVNQTTAANGGTVVPSFVFYHIPTRETEIAWQQYKEDRTIGSGWNNETVCAQGADVGFFDKVLELGSTKALIYGHDHVNNTLIDYQGVKLCYGLKSGMTCYYMPGMLG